MVVGRAKHVPGCHAKDILSESPISEYCIRIDLGPPADASTQSQSGGCSPDSQPPLLAPVVRNKYLIFFASPDRGHPSTPKIRM
jgi:hypothetical protein